jgi:outer membrane lipoprotein-sorting protein
MIRTAGCLLSVFAFALWGITTQEILARMDRAAPAFSTMKAEVTRITYTKVIDEKSEETGIMLLKRRGKELRMLIEFRQPSPKIVVFSGRKGEVYYPKLNTIQEYDLSKHKQLIDQFLTLGFGATGRELAENYQVQVKGEEAIAGEKTVHMELIPKSAAARQNISKIDLWMTEAGDRPVQQRFVQPSGDYTLIRYSHAQLNIPLSDEDLKLKAPKGVKREFPQR